MQDLLVNLDDITKLENSNVLSLSALTKRPIDYALPGEVAQLSFRMSLDQTVVTRNGYTVLDVLSDMGGFQRVLYSFFSLIAYILNMSNFDSYLASKLYKLSDNSKNSRPDLTKSTYFNHKENSSLKEFFGKILPRKILCKSCKKSKR